MPKFKVGEIVQLKSGGPKMTVVGYSISSRSLVECAWFSGAKSEEGTFPEESLQYPVEEKKKEK